MNHDPAAVRRKTYSNPLPRQMLARLRSVPANDAVVLDCSNFDTATFRGECLSNEIGGVIVGCQSLAAARSMVQISLDHGIPVRGLYGFLYTGLSGELNDFHNLGTIASEFGKRIGERAIIDIEASWPNESENATTATRIASAWRAIEIVKQADCLPVAYSYEPYWRSQMSNLSDLAISGIDLWLAHYLSSTQPLPFTRTRAGFGAWRDADAEDIPGVGKLIAHQWTSVLDKCGRKRDANHLFAGWENDVLLRQELLERRTIQAVAGGPYDQMKAAYHALQTQGLIDDSDGAIGVGDDTLNGGVVRRFRLVQLAAGDRYHDAYVLIQ